MKIAVLAWGSLVWCPRELQTAAKFAANGPLLPIEFCRISKDGRLTLAIDETFGAICKTYSAPSGLDTLDAAIENLRLREKMPNARAVGFVELGSGRQNGVAVRRHPEAVASIAAWAGATGCDAAIWTALASNFEEQGGEPFSLTAAMRYLETLEAKDATAFRRALAYIQKAPAEVETPLREEAVRRWAG